MCFLFDIIVIFIIQNLKSKQIPQYTNRAKLIYFSLVLTEREEKETKYFAPERLVAKMSADKMAIGVRTFSNSSRKPASMNKLK